MKFTSLLLAFYLGYYVEAETHWSYSGEGSPENWSSLGYPDCGGSSQSPINIEEANAVFESDLTIGYQNYGVRPSSMTLVNNGHSAQVNLESDMQIIINGIDGKYKASQFHFHWGQSDAEGSEHTINDNAFPMEMHIVHYHDSYSDLSSAADKEKGLAVLGFMFEISEDDNERLDTLIEGLESIRYKGDETSLEPFRLGSILPNDLTSFYRYQGSLTTPACYESVVWSVFRDTIKISEDQLEAFRHLYAGEEGGDHSEHLVNNFRPVQLLNGREVTKSWRFNINDAINRIFN